MALLLIGTFRLFGQEQDQLAGVFLMPLGILWLLWLDGINNQFLPWFAASAPLLYSASNDALPHLRPAQLLMKKASMESR
ncbi:hypothetical protein OEZ49_22260 [Ruegeria sp. WL0004]|uniref:Uncharacterized protein n=1 Tax=Ruegeria marisflavi TaxID=2984152 RepID=A0ABT2WYY9_9RHOB|nr:hypothetical protein [Ruegeria sp. WL0004]MCU9840477.1 hypothetical protein [Ruegeria sp. WL0004]